MRRAAFLAALFVMLSSVYMLVYSGRIESGDSLIYFDATASLAEYGDTLLDVSLWYNPPDTRDFSSPYPLKKLQIESFSPPLQPALASLFYRAARVVPDIGLVHTVWLFNVFVSAAAGCVFFAYALVLGYEERAALLSALALGLATIIVPYSKTFFRDPLALLFILLAALCLELLRQARFRSLLWSTAAALSILAALHTKTSIVFAFPALLLIAFPPFRFGERRVVQWGMLGLVGLVGIVLIILAYTPILDTTPNFQTRLRIDFRDIGLRVPPWDFYFYPYHVRAALHTYLFSVGGSIWGTSPIGLLALPGLWLWHRQHRQRYVWVILLLVVSYAVGHALLVERNWFGGVSWPPRFLVPVVPFMLLAALPVFERVVRRPYAIGWVVTTVFLLIYSLWIQFCAVSLAWDSYTEALPVESFGLTEWSPGLNQLEYLRWMVIPGLWASQPLDFAWVRVGVPLWAVGFAFLGVVSGVCLWRLIYKDNRKLQLLMLSMPLIFTIGTGLGLRAIFYDELYGASNPSLHAVIPLLDSVAQPNDYLVLSNNRYERFFLNYGKLNTVRVVTLPYQPGEQLGEDSPARVVADYPDALLTQATVPMLYELARQRPRMWLLMDSGPFIVWSTRPVERFMNTRFYPVRVLETDPPDATLRLIEYNTTNAPDPLAFRSPSYMTDLRYGDFIQLIGYDLPLGEVYMPGTYLPVSLYWQSEMPPVGDYTVAIKLADDTGRVVVEGMDSKPAGGFASTPTWKPGVPVWDNRALYLPDNLASGTYRLWVILYGLTNAGVVENLPVAGAEFISDLNIGVLPVTITIHHGVSE